MSKILVTGGAGYIGAHTVYYLLRAGFDVVVLDNLSRGYRHNVRPELLREADILDTETVYRILVHERVSAVIHFAAFIAVGESTREPALYFHNNVAGSLSLFRAMQQAGVSRLVFSSTAALYGNPSRTPIPEDLSLAPVSPYGESKAMVEKALHWLDVCAGFRSISLRYFNACGADPETGLGEEHDPETHLIPLLLRAIQTGRPLTVFGDDYDTPDGTCIRDYIHVSDLAHAHLLALESLLAGAPSQAFNVGTGTGHSVLEVIRAAEEVTGQPVPFRIGPRREGDAPILVADSSRLRETLGWRPRYTDIRDIIASAWRFAQRR